VTRAVIYARFSSDIQRHASIEDQLRVCRARAEREGWTVIEEFTDHAISGTIIQRPAYQALMAAIVRRIFTEFLAGRSPRHIAQALNAEGIPSPGGAIWYDSSIRGRPGRNDGLLRNPLYAGRLVWNCRRNTKEPFTGGRVRKPNAETELVTHAVPDLAIIDPPLWQVAQNRLRREAAVDPTAAATPPTGAGFWQRRRPRHLLTGKVGAACVAAASPARGRTTWPASSSAAPPSPGSSPRRRSRCPGSRRTSPASTRPPSTT